ncbi:hypothetical protein CGCA056_v006239 [Colletotrichum aenigma]|uniref:uncharacterized protein n=1 Tax=Colletotrichum aenigma TaxID=1215731 RepID=UPI00187226F1|nr:uncharacterized protein CGCA056_v006239 [Colletotrichum aenigma]KAF5522416.1 hypothetical protein CGCA056_v006239 [Colletotrichum aenigma]
MDILQLHQNRYAPFVSFFVKEILVNKEVPKSLVEYFTTMIVCHLPAGDTIREIGLFVYHSRQHKLPDLMKSEWRWLNIHLPTIGDFGIEDVVSTETALLELWKAMAEVAKDDDNLTKVQEFAQDSIEDSKAMLDTTKSANETFINSQLNELSL